ERVAPTAHHRNEGVGSSRGHAPGPVASRKPIGAHRARPKGSKFVGAQIGCRASVGQAHAHARIDEAAAGRQPQGGDKGQTAIGLARRAQQGGIEADEVGSGRRNWPFSEGVMVVGAGRITEADGVG
nr:hypothetical protein [Tanacetum cinerariifolium]